MLFLSPLLQGLSKQSIVRCADNTGVIKAAIIGLGRNRHGTGKIGDRVRLSIRDKTTECAVAQLPKGIIVRRKKESARKDGSYLKFDDNAVVIIAKNKLRGSKIKGPVPLEVRHHSKNLSRFIF